MPHPVIPQRRESGRVCVCVCVGGGGGGGGVARQYKGVKKTRNYSKWGQYKVASGDLVHTGPGTAARRDIDRADMTTLGAVPPAAALVGLPCTATLAPGGSISSVAGIPSIPVLGDKLSLGGLPRLTTNPGGRGLGITVNGDSMRLLVVMSFTQVLARQHERTSTGRTRPLWARCPQQLPSRVQARQPEGTLTGRTRSLWARCPQQLPSLGSLVLPRRPRVARSAVSQVSQAHRC